MVQITSRSAFGKNSNRRKHYVHGGAAQLSSGVTDHAHLAWSQSSLMASAGITVHAPSAPCRLLWHLGASRWYFCYPVHRSAAMPMAEVAAYQLTVAWWSQYWPPEGNKLLLLCNWCIRMVRTSFNGWVHVWYNHGNKHVFYFYFEAGRHIGIMAVKHFTGKIRIHKVLKSTFWAFSVGRPFELWPFQTVAGLWMLRCVSIWTCGGSFGLKPFRFVAISVCSPLGFGHSFCGRYVWKPFVRPCPV